MPDGQDEHLPVRTEDWQFGYRAWGSLSEHGQGQQDSVHI